jgi:hypothetical protein
VDEWEELGDVGQGERHGERPVGGEFGQAGVLRQAVVRYHLHSPQCCLHFGGSYLQYASVYLRLPPFAFILLRFTSIQPRFASIRLHFTAICIYFRLKRMNFYIKPPLEDYDEHVDSIGRNQGMPWEMYDL